MKRNSTLPALAASAVNLVLPEQLAQQAADAVRELLAEAAAANTTRSYAAALRYWAGWHQARYGIELALPASEAVVIQFLVDHIQRKNKTGLVIELPPAIDQALFAAGLKAKVGPLKLSTVVQRVAVLSTAHKLKRLANPCELPSVRTLLNRARRAAVKRGERPTKKTAITRPELEAMLATCDDSLEGLRDRALPCSASGSPAAGDVAARSPPQTCGTCARSARTPISIDLSIPRRSRPGCQSIRPRTNQYWGAAPRRSRLGSMRQKSMRVRSSGGFGRGGSALPSSQAQWRQSSSVALSWQGWRGTLVHIA